MRTLYLMIVGLFMIILVGCSSNSSMGKVDIGGHGFIRSPQQKIAVLEGGQDGTALGLIKVNQYFHLYVEPGVHKFTGMFNDGHGNGITTSVSLQAGKTYYFQIVQLPAIYTQDILVKPRHVSEATVEMTSFTNITPGQALAKPGKALVYFYYALTTKERAAIQTQQEKNKMLEKKLGCTDTQMREGTCQ